MLQLAVTAGSRREFYHHDDSGAHMLQDNINSDLPEPYTFLDSKRNMCCLSGFRELYENEQLFDVTLSVDGKEFHGHRSLLAASSDYFKAMFTTSLAEKDQKVVTINEVDNVSMAQIMNYLYSGEAKMLSHTVQNLLSAANLFQLQDLRDGCANFMARKLDVDNCIGVHFFAQLHECENLEFQAWDMITESFDAVSCAQEFLTLSPENLIEIIKYDDIMSNEDEVFEAAVRWLHHAAEERSEFIYNVFVHIRLALIDEHYFYDEVKSNIHLQRVPQLVTVFDEVIRYKLLKSRWMESDLRLEPRYGADFCRVVVYTSYMDDEKKQVLQLYGQRSDEATSRNANILCDIPADIENPSILVTGDNELYIAGGDGLGKCLYKWCYEDATFEEMSSMTVNRKQFSLVQVDKSIYAVGGCNSEDGNLTSVSRYLEGDDDWEDVSELPKALRCMTCVAYHGKLYLFGGECERINKKVGRGKKELNKQTFCYDPREDKWNVLADMPTARALAGCTIFRNKIFVIGGFGTVTESWLKDKSPENCLTTVEMYDPETNSWEEGPELLVPLCAMGVVKYYGTIYVMGGENDEDVSNNVYYLNTEENKWEHKDEMVTGMTETTIHSSYAVINIDMESH